jgi:succinylglutamate desuccinylase
MDNLLFKQSFLIDSLNDESGVNTHCISSNGTTYKRHANGILEVIPANFDYLVTKNVIISCGVHGNETAPIELVNNLITDIISGQLIVTQRCLFIIANVEAVKQNRRYIDENLNRLFDDAPRESSKELVLADKLKILVNSFFKDTSVESRWHFDLHCAIRHSQYSTFAISPKSRYPVRDKQLFDLMESGGIEAIVLANAPSSTFSWYTASQLGVKALTVELGQVGLFGQNNLQKLTDFDQVLRSLLCDETIKTTSKSAIIYRVSRSIIRMHDKFEFLFDEDVANFTTFIHGEVFGHDGDKPLMAKNDGEAILFPNINVNVGERAALMVCEVSGRFEQGQLVYD